MKEGFFISPIEDKRTEEGGGVDVLESIPGEHETEEEIPEILETFTEKIDHEKESFVLEGEEKIIEVEASIDLSLVEEMREKTGIRKSLSFLREKFELLVKETKERIFSFKRGETELGIISKETIDDFVKTVDEKEEDLSEHKNTDRKLLEEKIERPEVDVDGFPVDTQSIQKTHTLGGSSGVEMGMMDEDSFFAIKRPRSSHEQSKDQLKEEYITDAIYSSMGFSVPKSKLYGGSEKVSHFVLGKDLNAIGNKGYAGLSREKIKKEVQKGFVLDCLLGNWDVIGMNEDNIRVSDDGKVYRIDNGGSLRFRARGELKKEKEFGPTVGELETMRKDSKIFGDVSDGMISDQIKEIISHKSEIIDTILNVGKDIEYTPKKVKKIREIIEERINYLSEWRDEYRKREKGIYESAVTNRYFENWDDLILEGNEGIKEKIHQNIINAEEKNKSTYESLAEDFSVSIDRIKEILQERIERIISQSNFFRATNMRAFEKIMLEDGRWKSQFETNTSDGSLSPRYRAGAEYDMFGFEADVDKDKEKRCIYGYFSSGQYGEINREGKTPPPNSVSYYGKITFKVKRDIALRKATITSHDSLNHGGFFPSPASKPHFTSIKIYDKDTVDKMENSKKIDWGNSSYTEVQYHTGLSLDDIECIYISEKNGMRPDEIKEVKRMFGQYKEEHPESAIELIEY